MNQPDDLTVAELEQLTEAMNKAIVAEYDLFRLNNDVPIPHLTPGATRAVLRALSDLWAIQIRDVGRGVRYANWDEFRKAASAEPIPAPAADFDVTVNPEDVQDGDGGYEPADQDEDAPPFQDQVIAALHEMAVDGKMPGQIHWDHNRPDGLPTNNAVRKRLGMQWTELAAAAGLTPARRGRRKSSDTDTPSAEPEPKPASPTLAEADAVEGLTADETPPSPYSKIAAMDAEAKSDMLQEIIYQLQKMAEKRVIPDATTWNQNRPADLPSAQDITLLWRLDSWYDLAGHAGLQKPSHELRRLRGASGDRYARMLEGNGA